MEELMKQITEGKMIVVSPESKRKSSGLVSSEH